MSDTEMASEPQAETKVAFATRKYSNDDKRKAEEEELEQLIAENKGEVAEEVEAEPENAEEKTFKKRYGDLRKHSQETKQSLEKQVNELRKQLDKSTKQEIKLPKSDDDIDAWAAQYPDVAAIVETIAIKKAREQSRDLEDRVKEIDAMRETATKEKAEVELLKIHPDFSEIRDSDDFHDWAKEQPKWVQDALYENDNDARSAARAIDLYKIDNNISTKKSSNNKDAARSVNSKQTRNAPETDKTGGSFKESQVAKMTAQEYERNSDVIMEAIRSGRFVYDVSGNAR
tara:strand:- start:163 stop:1023 length:861 start_codon:yes stop_codon:yes gene_type:complete